MLGGQKPSRDTYLKRHFLLLNEGFHWCNEFDLWCDLFDIISYWCREWFNNRSNVRLYPYNEWRDFLCILHVLVIDILLYILHVYFLSHYSAFCPWLGIYHPSALWWGKILPKSPPKWMCGLWVLYFTSVYMAKR